MSFPRYAEYKDSGVAWLGEVPTYWEARPLKYLAKLVTGLTPPTDVHENYAEDGFPWIRPEDINETGAVTLASKFLSEGGAEISRHLAPLSTLICCIGTIGKAGIIGVSAATNQQITAASFQGSAKYFYYATCAARTEIETSATGNVLKILNTERLGRIGFPDPPDYEQSAIAAFLDRETGKIDALIAEQEKLLILLAEKRQATISHAVTRGLNPDAPMKDSGVPWLGEVPSHWTVTRCGRYLSVLSGFAFPSMGFDHTGNGVRLLRGVNVGVSSLRWDDVVFWQRAAGDGLESYELRGGDVVIGMDRPLISAGMRVAKVCKDDLPCLLLQRVASLRTSAELKADFLMLYLSTDMFVAHFSPDTTGVSVPHISPDQIGSFVIAIPSIEEQQQILSRIEIELASLDRLAAEAERGVALLKERRSALIAAAVTGKIDVRGVPRERAA